MTQKWILDASNPVYRTIRATAKILKHELIFESEALTLSAFQNLRSHFCSYCFTESDSLFKCANCSHFYYCGQECQKKDWVLFHKLECDGLKKLKDQHISNELVLSWRLYLYYKSNGNFRDTIIQMKSHEDSYTPEELKEMKEIAIRIVEILAEDLKEESTIFSILCKVKINFFTIEKPSFIMNMSVGAGFYQGEANFFNHSCLPNSIKIYSNRKLRIFAAEEILPGEEIFICYDDVLGKPFNWRQAYLQKQYNMKCCCRLCSREMGTINDENYSEIGLKCGKCPSKSEIKGNKCISCHFQYKSDELAAHQRELEERVVKAKHNLKSLEEFLAFFEDLQRNYLDVHSYLIEMALSSLIHNFLIPCFETHTLKLYKLLKFYVVNYRKWFDIEIPSLGFKINELSKLALKLNKGKKARKYTEEAWTHLSGLFPENLCKELKDLAKRRITVQGLLELGNEVHKNESKGILKID